MTTREELTQRLDKQRSDLEWCVNELAEEKPDLPEIAKTLRSVSNNCHGMASSADRMLKIAVMVVLDKDPEGGES